MFCTSCVTEWVSAAQYYQQFGHTIPSENALKRGASATVDDNGAGGSGTVSLIFAHFKAREEEDRKGYFRSKCPKTSKRSEVVNQSDVNSEATESHHWCHDTKLGRCSEHKEGITLPTRPKRTARMPAKNKDVVFS